VVALFDSSEDKNKEAQPAQPSPSPTSSARPIPATLRDVARSEPPGEPLASIGRGSRIIGKLHFDGNVRIEGSVEGEVSAGDVLQIGERAVVNAQISGTVIVIRGQVTGEVRARKRVEVRAPGKLRGNVTTPSLVIDDGVTFEGYCSMGAEHAEPAKGSPPTRGGNPATP
jgi:cytoskeletal protein CcmA (bactofilin family)